MFQPLPAVPPLVATDPVSTLRKNRHRATCHPPRLPAPAERQLCDANFVGWAPMMSAISRSGDAHVWMHLCGNITAILPDLIEIGLNVLNPVQPQAMDVRALSREFGGKVCFNGGVDVQGTLVRGHSRKGVAQEAPGAYKDVTAVVNAAHHAGLSRKVARLKPLVCIKG